MNAPVILTVLDSRLHVVARTLVEYEKEPEVRAMIKDMCDKNEWTIRSEVPGGSKFFISELNRKDRNV